MNRKLILDLIIEYNLESKWLQEKIAAYDADVVRRGLIVEAMQKRSPEWNAGSPAEKRVKYAKILEEVTEAI
jgi:hypothetical protein